MFRWREQVPATPEGVGRPENYGVDWAVTDRFDGASTGIHAAFNLGAGVDDLPEVVSRNRAILAAEFGVESGSLCFMRQEHGTHVHVVGAAGGGHQDAVDLDGAAACDGIVTNDPDVALAVLVADCTPVLLFDRRAGWVGAVHAGRVGMTEGVVLAAVQTLRQRGADDLQALVGPSICARCYEVPLDMRTRIAARHPAAHAVSWSGTPAIDVAGAVVDQLNSERVPVHWLPGCTRESPDLYSHRGYTHGNDPHTGRFAAVVRLRT
ncbi:MAG: polyphenol oxidase family protein [Ornithinimicrobium sp.]